MKQKIVLIMSAAVGIAAAMLTRAYLTAKDAETRRLINGFYSRHGIIEVLGFARDVPGGTILTMGDLGTKKVPSSGLRGQALTKANLQDVIGKKTIIGHKKDDVIFWSDVEGGNPVATGLAADIRRRKRAISVNVAGAASVSGMVKPNDHVDVIGTFSFPKPSPDGKNILQELVTCTILQNVLVLATGKETAKTPVPIFGSSSYATVTLEVTPREAEMLVFAEQIKGRLVLSLRNRNDMSYEKELPQVDFEKIRSEIEELNVKRQLDMGGRR